MSCLVSTWLHFRKWSGYEAGVLRLMRSHGRGKIRVLWHGVPWLPVFWSDVSCHVYLTMHSSLFLPPCLVQCVLYSTGDLAPYPSPMGARNLWVLRVTTIWLLPRPHFPWPSLHSCLTPVRVLLSSKASGQTLGYTWDLSMLLGITGGPGKLTQGLSLPNFAEQPSWTLVTDKADIGQLQDSIPL